MAPQSDNADYPYQPQWHQQSELTPAAAWQARSHWIRRWMARIAVFAIVLFLLFAAGTGVLTFRAVRQAWSIEHLEKCGCSVSYWHQGPNGKDWLPASLRERLDDRWWGQVQEVTIIEGGYWDGIFSFRDTDENDIRQIVAACRTFPYLTSFIVHSNFFTCDQIARWPNLHHLDEVGIDSTKLKDSDLAIIGKMTALKSLRVVSGSFSCEGLSHIANLPNLERLGIERATINGSCALTAQPFQALVGLTVSQSPGFNDDVIALFGRPPNLEEIYFHAVPIGDRGLDQIIGGGKVHSLVITEAKITDAGVAMLANHPPPQYVVLSRMPITDAALGAFVGKPFNILVLDHTALTDEAFRSLSKIDTLEHVSLDNSYVTGTGVGHLSANTKLLHLDVGGPALTPQGVRTLAAGPFTHLDLRGSKFGDSELMMFVNNDNLVQLTIPHTQVTEDGLRAFFTARRKRLAKADDVLAIMRDPNWDNVDSARTILDSSVMPSLDP